MSRRSDDQRGPGGPPSGGGEWFRYEPPGRRRGDDPEFLSGDRRRRSRRRARLFGYLLVAVFALVLGFATGYVRSYFASGEVGAPVTVVIERGDSLSTIASKLEQAGVIAHAGAFLVRVQGDGHSTELKPGVYALRQNEPYDELVSTLVEGQSPPAVKVTIPEGSTVEQSAKIASQAVVGIDAGEYVRIATKDPPPVQVQGYKAGTTVEGLLFPATYEVLVTMEARPFIEKQLDAFTRAMAKVDMNAARKANLTDYDVVIIASMIEREAQVAEERALVSAVIWNRLRADMPLQIDATIQYALGETKPVLTYDDLKVESPYNTYTHKGLPPTPIANPGLASLRAAANPAAVDYLYYVARADGTGRHYFSRTYEEFLANQAKAARNSQ